MSTGRTKQVLKLGVQATVEDLTAAIAEQDQIHRQAQADVQDLEAKQRDNAVAIALGEYERTSVEMARMIDGAKNRQEVARQAVEQLQGMLASRKAADGLAADRQRWEKVRTLIEQRDRVIAQLADHLRAAGELYQQLWPLRSQIKDALPYTKERMVEFVRKEMHLQPFWDPDAVELLVWKTLSRASGGMLTGDQNAGRDTPYTPMEDAMRRLHASILEGSGLLYEAPNASERKVVQAIHPDEGLLPKAESGAPGSKTMQGAAARQARAR
jgi:hypothetical protein